jgi:hypothetical protein
MFLILAINKFFSSSSKKDKPVREVHFPYSPEEIAKLIRQLPPGKRNLGPLVEKYMDLYNEKVISNYTQSDLIKILVKDFWYLGWNSERSIYENLKKARNEFALLMESSKEREKL